MKHEDQLRPEIAVFELAERSLGCLRGIEELVALSRAPGFIDHENDRSVLFFFFWLSKLYGQDCFNRCFPITARREATLRSPT